MRVRIPLGLFIKMENEKVVVTNNKGILFALILLFGIFAIIWFLIPSSEIQIEGNPTDEFCREKCNEKELGDLTYSLNNSEYNLIECACVAKEIVGEGKDTIDLYFDSINLEEISKKEAELRLK